MRDLPQTLHVEKIMEEDDDVEIDGVEEGEKQDDDVEDDDVEGDVDKEHRSQDI